MSKFLGALHSKIVYAFSLVLAFGCTLVPQAATAQNIPAFIDGLGLEDTNTGRAAKAIQRTCGELIQTGFVSTTGASAGNELWRRCNELVATAQGLTSGTLTRTLGYTENEDLLAAFQQVNGEETLAQSSLAQNGSYEQFSSIGARLGALRGASSASVTSVAANGSEFMYGSGGGAAADAPFSPWGWFIRGTYTSGDRDPSDPNGFVGEEDGFDFDQYGMTFGVDHSSGSRVWGVAVNYSSYDLEMQSLGTGTGSTVNRANDSTIKSDSVNATVYFDYTSNSNVYFSALAGFGGQSFDLARSFVYVPTCDPCEADVVRQDRDLVGAPDGDSQASTLSLGRMIQRGSWVIDPHIGLTYDNVTIDSFLESDTGNTSGAGIQSIENAMNLEFDEQEIKSFRATLGVQFSKNVNTSFGSVRPTFSVDWHHEFEDDPRELRVKYALENTLTEAAVVDNPDPMGPAFVNDFSKGFDGCVSCFSLLSEAPDSDFFVLGAGVAASHQNGIQSFVMLEGLLGYDNLSTYALTIGVRGQF